MVWVDCLFVGLCLLIWCCIFVFVCCFSDDFVDLFALLFVMVVCGGLFVACCCVYVCL